MLGALDDGRSIDDVSWHHEETIRGARFRAGAAREALGADLGIGIEGGHAMDRVAGTAPFLVPAYWEASEGERSRC